MPNQRQKKANSCENVASRDVSVVRQEVLDKIRSSKVPHSGVMFPTPESVVISKQDINRIRQNAKYISPYEIELEKSKKLEQLKKENQICEQRKEKMRQLDINNCKTKNQSLSDIELESLKENKLILDNATKKLLQNNQHVKKMNSLVLYAKCAAVRDRQLIEKETAKEKAKIAEKRLDQIMENERLNALKIEAEKEEEKRIETKKGAQIITQQMQYMRKQRLVEQDLKKREGVQLIEKLKKLDQQEELKKQEKILQGKKLLEAIKHANKQIVQARAEAKQREKEEQDRISKYLADKDARQAEYQAQQQQIQAQKENAKTKMIQQQEKRQGHEKSIQDMRIQRAQEERERKWRQQEKESAIKKMKTKQILNEARQRQRLEKELRLAEQAAAERIEFEKNILAYQQQEQMIEKEQKLERTKIHQYRNMLQNQINENEKYKNIVKNDFEIKQQQQFKLQKQQIETLKKAKIDELTKLGVPEKYMVDLKRYQID